MCLHVKVELGKETNRTDSSAILTCSHLSQDAQLCTMKTCLLCSANLYSALKPQTSCTRTIIIPPNITSLVPLFAAIPPAHTHTHTNAHAHTGQCFHFASDFANCYLTGKKRYSADRVLPIDRDPSRTGVSVFLPEWMTEGPEVWNEKNGTSWAPARLFSVRLVAHL